MTTTTGAYVDAPQPEPYARSEATMDAPQWRLADVGELVPRGVCPTDNAGVDVTGETRR
jgi:hypothetical protein